MTEALLSCQNLGVRREGRWLLHDVDLSVARGEVVTIVGPNGGGKTTLLRTLMGVIKADSGRVFRKNNLRLGYVPQRLGLDSVLPLSVHRLLNLTRKVARDEARSVLAATGVEHLINTQIQHLSGGEFQRVLLARALVGKPEVMVLDEPVQGVDYAGEAAIYALIANIRAQMDCAVIMVSHDLHVVMGATDRVVCLNGHICCSGAPHHVEGHPEYRRLFGPRLAENFAVYQHHHDHSHDSCPPHQAVENKAESGAQHG